MGFLKNMIRNAVDEGINKGIRDAVSTAAEKIIAPKAEAYANKVADSLDEAARSMTETENVPKQSGTFSSLEESLNRMSRSAERYAAMMEQAAGAQENLIDEWSRKLPDFPVWCFGGHDFYITDPETTDTGTTYCWFNVEDATQEGLDLYVALLKQNGFVQKYPGADEVLYKDLGGEYLLFGKTDAFGTAPTMSVSMSRTKDRSEIEI